MSRLPEVFEDKALVAKIRERLPYLFQLAELESSRAGKVGMEVGSVREKILVSLLIYKFGRENVETEIPITESEIDARLFDQPVSIKTVTGSGGVKLIWTVDAEKARIFRETYHPKHDLFIVLINWGTKGKLSVIPSHVQQEIFNAMGRENYITLPKQGTNPRGVEISRKAFRNLLSHPETRSIDILWQRSKNVEFDPYERWIKYWEEARA